MMPCNPLYPFLFKPILKRILWGGRRLGSILNKPLGDACDYAESWEVSEHRNDVSIVAEGPLAGTTLQTLVRDHGEELLGPAIGPCSQFPLLVKFLDAHQVLSVQVHPDDALGRKLADDNGKTEAWVIVHSEPGSVIYAGLRPGATRSAFAEALESGLVEPLLHRFEPKAGDCIMIPAGTVHAIGAGVVLAEVQQMSDATFRVHDWGRVGAGGLPRTLHKAEALESTDFSRGPVDPMQVVTEPFEGGLRERLARCPYFALERSKLSQPALVGSRERFTLILCLEGHCDIRYEAQDFALGLGQTRLLPAALGTCQVRPRGQATVLTCVIPSEA
jgi:mannose-6-phosphate isomerase